VLRIERETHMTPEKEQEVDEDLNLRGVKMVCIAGGRTFLLTLLE